MTAARRRPLPRRCRTSVAPRHSSPRNTLKSKPSSPPTIMLAWLDGSPSSRPERTEEEGMTDLAVVLQQRFHRNLQSLAAVEEGELDDAGRRRNHRAHALEQGHRGRHGPAGRQEIVDQHQARALLDRILLDLD